MQYSDFVLFYLLSEAKTMLIANRGRWRTLALLLVFTSCRSKPPVNVAAMVGNRAITYEELEKNFQSRFEAGQERSSDDQVMIQKVEILRGLIDSEIML